MCPKRESLLLNLKKRKLDTKIDKRELSTAMIWESWKLFVDEFLYNKSQKYQVFCRRREFNASFNTYQQWGLGWQPSETQFSCLWKWLTFLWGDLCTLLLLVVILMLCLICVGTAPCPWNYMLSQHQYHVLKNGQVTLVLVVCLGLCTPNRWNCINSK